MDDTNFLDDRSLVRDPGFTLEDLAPIISDLDLAPHSAIAAIRTVNTWMLTREQKLEIIWLVGKLVQSKNGRPEDVETFLSELHRFQESKVCCAEENLKALRNLVAGETPTYDFQCIQRDI